MEFGTFGLVRNINHADSRTWQNRIFLTFDIDWANDEVIEDAVGLVEAYGVSATWFITHRTEKLDRIRENDQFDIGLHPNFNTLLNGDSEKNSSADSILSALSELAPEAKAVRSHSLVHSERLVDLFVAKGLQFACNNFIPIGNDNRITPWQLWGGLTMIPHCWQDNVALKLDIRFPTLSNSSGHLVVCNFHPIHIFLNTEHLDRYEKTRHLHQNPAELIKHRFNGYGTRSRLIELLEYGSSS